MIEVFEKSGTVFKSFEGSMSIASNILSIPYPATLVINQYGTAFIFRKMEDGSESVKCLGDSALKVFEIIETDEDGEKHTVFTFMHYEFIIPGHVGSEILL